MKDYITYQEYCDILGLNYTETTVKPKWFDSTQKRALNYLYRNVAQSHVFPQTKEMHDNLKTWIKEQFDVALANQIQYMYVNRQVFENPASVVVSSTIGNYAHGPMGDNTLEGFIRLVCPVSYDALYNIGLMYASLDDKYKLEEFYDLDQE